MRQILCCLAGCGLALSSLAPLARGAETSVEPTLAESAPAQSLDDCEPQFSVFVEEEGVRWPLNLGEASAQIAHESQTGSLLFSRGDCLAVRIYTGSGYTHVATLVESDGETYVYDSMNGTGVRRLTLQTYLETQSPDEIRLFHPGRSFTEEECAEFRTALDDRIGKPYAVAHHLTGRRCHGIHCAEYVTDALMEIDWLRAENPVKVSPASLAEGILVHDVFRQGSTMCLAPCLEPVPEADGRMQRIWQFTKDQASSCCRQMSRWVLCR